MAKRSARGGQRLPYEGKRVTVMGLGQFGGGLATVRYYAEKGAEVTVTDLHTEAELSSVLPLLDDLPRVRRVLGGHDPEDFRRADLVVVNPAVRPGNELVQLAVQSGAAIEREINLVLKRCRAKIVAVTGSNGKSTTTAMLGEMARALDPRVQVGGNIGRSVLPAIENHPPDAPVILELSSFQLQGMRELNKGPHIAVITNLTPNHLDWHESFAEYRAAKAVILQRQRKGDAAVLNGECPQTRELTAGVRGRLFLFGVERPPESDAADGVGFVRGDDLVVRIKRREEVVGCISTMRVPGRHNLANALAAALAARVLGVGTEAIRTVLAEFRGLPHRLEKVASLTPEGPRLEGDDSPLAVSFYNDSIATTPEATICGLNSFRGPITLIAGGYNKGLSFAGLARHIVARVRRLITLGASGREILEAVIAAAQSAGVPRPLALHVGDMAYAVRCAGHDLVPGESVLLSPACASYDQYANFQQRGEHFRRLARELVAGLDPQKVFGVSARRSA